ncbi:MAG: anthranilate phosphoribosyltransferase, partial [Desulfosalsimonas sp.]
RQLVGVFAPELTEMFARALQRLGTKRALVVHGHDGMDEITVCAPTRVCELKDDRINTYDISPDNYFGRMADPEEILGGDPARSAQIAKNILSGEKGACRDIVLINAAAALMAADRAQSIEEGIEMAESSIDTGAARDKLESLAEFTRENA